MSDEKKKESRDKILEIIDQFDKKTQTQISYADNISDLNQKLKLLVSKVGELEEDLSNKDLIIELMNQFGQLIESKQSDKGSTLINLSEYAKGVYYIRISNNSKKYLGSARIIRL